MSAPATIAPDKKPRSCSNRKPRSPQEDPCEAEELSGKEASTEQWEERDKAARQALSQATLDDVAKRLDVSAVALGSLGMGFDKYAVTFPMFDPSGRCCGLRLRPLGDLHSKQAADGSALGLFLPDERRRGKIALVCEGESDTAAGLTLGFASVGTPGAGQCAEDVAEFLRARLTSAPCVIGHNDPDGAGEKGAERIAAALLAAGVPCRVLIVPAPWNDLRAWRTAQPLTAGALKAAIRDCPLRWPEHFPKGFAAVPNHLAKRGAIRVVGATAWACWCAIASFADEDGQCWPGRELIAELVGVDVRTVDAAKERLRAAGLLAWKRGGIVGGAKRANVYQVDFGEKF